MLMSYAFQNHTYSDCCLFLFDSVYLTVYFSFLDFYADNVFSSLVGLQFMWELKPESNGLPHHLAHVPLKDSPLSDCGGLCGDLDIQISLEDSVSWLLVYQCGCIKRLDDVSILSSLFHGTGRFLRFICH